MQSKNQTGISKKTKKKKNLLKNLEASKAENVNEIDIAVPGST